VRQATRKLAADVAAMRPPARCRRRGAAGREVRDAVGGDFGELGQSSRDSTRRRNRGVKRSSLRRYQYACSVRRREAAGRVDCAALARR
jgi:hypothetical protein